MQTAIVVKWLTQRIVAPSLVGSNPISRPIKQIKPCIKANGVNLRKFRLAPFFCFVQGDVFLFFIHKLSM